MVDWEGSALVVWEEGGVGWADTSNGEAGVSWGRGVGWVEAVGWEEAVAWVVLTLFLVLGWDLGFFVVEDWALAEEDVACPWQLDFDLLI